MVEHMGELGAFFEKHAAVLRQHFPVFATVATACFGIGFATANLFSDRKVEILEQRVAAYQDRLDGDTPDQAHAKMKALEDKVAALQPRRLTTGQLNQLANALANNPGAVEIETDSAAGEMRQFAGDLEVAFTRAQWRIANSSVLSPSQRPRSGVAVIVADAEKLTAKQSLVVRALKSIGVEFEIVTGEPRSVGFDQPVATVLLTTRLN